MLVLGLPLTAHAQEPARIDRVLDVAVGDAIRGHAGCVAREVGPVLCWSGPNVLHETGRYFGAMTGPRAQPGTDGVVRIARGADVLCGVHRDGRVLCWRAGYAAPVEAPVRDAVELAMNGVQGCVTRRDGSVGCFEAPLPQYVRPGSPPPTVRAHPAPEVAAARHARSVTVGAGLGCAVEATSARTECWAIETGRAAPVPPIVTPGPGGAAVIAHGGAIACVIDRAGAILCRTGGSGPQPETRFAEAGAARFVHVAIGETTACAVTDDGRLACWGPRPRRYTITSDEDAERRVASSRPAWIVPGVADARRVSIAATHVCVVTGAGHARCFGPNESGELGDGTTTERTSPSFVVRHDVLPDPPHRAYGCAATLAQRRTCPTLGDDCVLQPVPGGWDLGPGGGAYCGPECLARRELALSAMPVPACECSCDPVVRARREGPPGPPPPMPTSAPPSSAAMP
jgi:hypothetical protein